jgi:hypothetical protein
MSDLDEDNDLTSTGDSEPPEPLVKWERICALIVGAVCGGAGGYVVFEKSNQAGTAILLILAAIFLLIGVQGTPLIRFGSSSGRRTQLQLNDPGRLSRPGLAKRETHAIRAAGLHQLAAPVLPVRSPPVGPAENRVNGG